MQDCDVDVTQKSSGYDDVSNYLLCKIVNVIKEPLYCVFNKSLASGKFPELLKLSKIVPLYKSGEKSIPDNYRPISLLPVISKVLEKLVFFRMVNHLEENKIVYLRQFGFRKGHSTTDAIMTLVGDILKCFESNLMILSVFIDLKKAFDMVPHNLILEKLQVMGVQDTELIWFTDYLLERKQFVTINNQSSDVTSVNVSVPQGSLLSVILFQLLINDLPAFLKSCISILYADDTTLYVVGHSLKFLKIKMQRFV